MKRLTVVVAMLWLLALVACTPSPTSVPATTAAPVTSAPTKAAWEQDWDRTLKAAKDEGTVFVYTGFPDSFRQALSPPMKEKYGINVEFVLGPSAQIVERIMTEQRSQTNVADVVIIGSSQHQMTLWPAKVDQPLAPVLVLPEVLDPKAWWDGNVPWVDREAKTVFQFYAYVQPPFAINTGMVKPDELKSYLDISKFKGRILMDDPTAGSGPGIQQLALTQVLMGWDYLQQLAQLEPVLMRDRTLAYQWLGQGKYPLLVGPEPDVLANLKKQGVPVSLVTPVEGASVTPGFGTLALVKGSPHPNAAKIFINFLLSKEGQTAASRATMSQSGRVDVPTDHLDPDVVRKPGMKYASATDEKFMAGQVDLYNKIIALFKPLVK